MSDTPQRPVRAVCHRCGGPKRGPFVPCKTCEFVPLGEDRPIAWLFGLDYLTEEEMLAAGERIRGGEVPDPSSALRELARGVIKAGRSLERNQGRPLMQSREPAERAVKALRDSAAALAALRSWVFATLAGALHAEAA